MLIFGKGLACEKQHIFRNKSLMSLLKIAEFFFFFFTVSSFELRKVSFELYKSSVEL